MARTATDLIRRYGRALKWMGSAFLLLVVLDTYYLYSLWPDWDRLAQPGADVPRSSFIRNYESRQLQESGWPVLRWNPVPMERMPRHLLRAVLIAEDARFYEHSGFDIAAIKEAFHYNLEKGKVVRGASTISQQTAKNLFLSPSRDPLRKWHEVVLTWAMEHRLSKARILELYLNIVELGRGIYGVDAAARAYWNKPVSALSVDEAAELAATLPSPKRSNPYTRSAFFTEHSAKIKRRLNGALGLNRGDKQQDADEVPWYKRPPIQLDEERF